MSEQNINQFLKIGGSRLLLDLLISIVSESFVIEFISILFFVLVGLGWLQQGRFFIFLIAFYGRFEQFMYEPKIAK